MLVGRGPEQEEIDKLLAAARGGASGVLVFRGEAGIGKTALLDYAAGEAAGWPILRIVVSEYEAELPFAALHMLLKTGGLDHPAAELRSRLESGRRHDAFQVGLALLTLLAEVNPGGPVLVIIDDAQWLDEASAEALLFAARRLDDEGVVVLFAVRDGVRHRPSPGLRELHLDRLPADAARRLLADRDLAPQAEERLIAESGGNPLALHELTAALSAEQRAGLLSPLPCGGADPAPAPSRVQKFYRARIRLLPAATRTLLLICAADDSGHLATVLAAAETLGATAADLEPAERRDLIQVGEDRVLFRHPLIRSAVYHDATYTRRVAVHRALAAAVDPDRRAWHLAATAAAPDEDIAAELEAAAGRTKAAAPASAALERAAQLSPTDHARGRRLVAAAALAIPAGQLARADALATQAAALATDPSTTIALTQVRAALTFEQGHPAEAARLLLSAPDHPTLLATAVHYATHAGDRALAYAAAARLTPAHPALPSLVRTPPQDPSSAPLAGSGEASSAVRGVVELARVMAGELLVDLAAVRGTVAVARKPGAGWEARLLGAGVGLAIGDPGAAELAAAAVRVCREQGLSGALAHALVVLAQAEAVRGRHREASVAATEACEVARGLGLEQQALQAAGLLAWLAGAAGNEERCRELAAKAAARGGIGAAMAAAALGQVELAAGRPEEALRQLGGIGVHPIVELHFTADVVEAAARAGDADRAFLAAGRLAEWSERVGEPWLEALAARCRALTCADEGAAEHFETALRLHEESDQPFEQARSALLYGEWLRRARHRGEARGHLGAAAAGFAAVGAAVWERRARTELAAGGGRPGEGEDERLAGLTPQERQVVLLAADGATSKEIAARLFLSPRTVEYHLYKAFPKLGVGSRAELLNRLTGST